MAQPGQRLRFSLRTVFVLVTLVAGWVGYHANWMRQRRDFIVVNSPPPVTRPELDDGHFRLMSWRVDPTSLPWGLWLLGETPVETIEYPASGDFDRVMELFPEARMFVQGLENAN